MGKLVEVVEPTEQRPVDVEIDAHLLARLAHAGYRRRLVLLDIAARQGVIVLARLHPAHHQHAAVLDDDDGGALPARRRQWQREWLAFCGDIQDQPAQA